MIILKPVENKVVVQTLAHLLTLVVVFLAARLGFELDAATSAEAAAAASLVASPLAGWLAKHTPRLDEAMKEALDVLAEAGKIPGETEEVPAEPTDVRDDEEMGEVLDEDEERPAEAAE